MYVAVGKAMASDNSVDQRCIIWEEVSIRLP